jgi:hypothetical protein
VAADGQENLLLPPLPEKKVGRDATQTETPQNPYGSITSAVCPLAGTQPQSTATRPAQWVPCRYGQYAPAAWVPAAPVASTTCLMNNYPSTQPTCCHLCQQRMQHLCLWSASEAMWPTQLVTKQCRPTEKEEAHVCGNKEEDKRHPSLIHASNAQPLPSMQHRLRTPLIPHVYARMTVTCASPPKQQPAQLLATGHCIARERHTN